MKRPTRKGELPGLPTQEQFGQLTLTLFDFNHKDEDGNPLRIQMMLNYNVDRDMLPPDGLKVTLGVGDACASGTLTVPLAMLNAGMKGLFDAHQKALKPSGLVGFNKPGIVLPS